MYVNLYIMNPKIRHTICALSKFVLVDYVADIFHDFFTRSLEILVYVAVLHIDFSFNLHELRTQKSVPPFKVQI